MMVRKGWNMDYHGQNRRNMGYNGQNKGGNGL